MTPGANDASEFQYGLGIIPSHLAEDGVWPESFEDPLLGLLQSHDTKMMSTEWMDGDSFGFLDHHHEDSILADQPSLPLTPPTTVGSLPTGSDESWAHGYDQQAEMASHGESFANETLPPSPQVSINMKESVTQRLLDLQTRLFLGRASNTQAEDGLSAVISTTVQSTEALIEIAESLPLLRPSVEGRRSTSPPSWGSAPDASSGFAGTGTAFGVSTELTQPPPGLALSISLFITCYLLLLDSYEELLTGLRARLQCSRQSQGPSPSNDFGLVQPFLGNAPNGKLSNFNLVSSFDLDVNSVVFLLSRMMKRLHKSVESRFIATASTLPTATQANGWRQGYQATNGSFNYDFQDALSQDTDGFSEPCSSGGCAPMVAMGDYALKEVSQRHQSVMESLRVIRWLADEL
ncbi:hypothetical protein CCHL11_06649 [Colletotrichum chlorophyti]|uniref:Uncharacterized protein n=1 Tax=Colletotrichum chlorophyti TaxID=708187 RepID=A0A1Q8RXT1_9PEZI|nr:hypothetical protein CCHL11_06649 [Colletotrichum chlorophyti]